MKKIFLFLITISLLLNIVGCSKSAPENSNQIINVSEENVSDYILASDNGQLALFNIQGEELDSLSLSSGKKSNFIYTMDTGNTYAKSLQNMEYIPNILYAVDKSNGRLYILKVDKKEIKEIDKKSLREKNIDKIVAYNGLFFYSVKAKNMWSNKYSFIKNEREKMNGIIDYDASLPVERSRPLSTYILLENYSDLFLDATGIKKNLKKEDFDKFQTTKLHRKTFELPCDADDWTANNKYIYFFYEDHMGEYILEKDQVGLYYGAKETVKSAYIDGRFKKVLTLNNFGGSFTQKSLLFELNYKNNRITRSIEIEEQNPLGLSVDKGQFIHMIFKSSESNEGSYAKLKTLKYKDYSDFANIPLKYMPTEVKSHNSFVYLFNPYEEHFLIGSAGSSSLSKYRKTYDNINYTNLLLVDFNNQDDYIYDSDGRYVNEENNLINADNELINSNRNKINKYGQLLDQYGRAVNSNGELIDKYNNVINESGNIVKHTKGEDGLFRDSLGRVVNEKGEYLIQNEEGDWILPIIEDEPIKGYYDENGKFVIDAEYLKKYPDAYTKLQEQQGDSNKKK